MLKILVFLAALLLFVRRRCSRYVRVLRSRCFLGDRLLALLLLAFFFTFFLALLFAFLFCFLFLSLFLFGFRLFRFLF